MSRASIPIRREQHELGTLYHVELNGHPVCDLLVVDRGLGEDVHREECGRAAMMFAWFCQRHEHCWPDRETARAYWAKLAAERVER